jgi:O-antigen ligase
MALLQALVVALAALIVTPGSLFYFDVTPKVTVVLAGTALALVWAALSGARMGRARLPAVFSVLLLLNVASLAVSSALSRNPALSLFGTNWRSFGAANQAAVCLFAWLVALGCAGRSDRVRTVLRGITVAGAVSALYGVGQYFGWDPLLPPAAYHVGEGVFTIVRPPGTLGYASYFATWLLFVVFLSLGLRTLETSAAWRRFAATAALLAGCAMLLTGTRAAVLGLGAGGLVWMMVGRVRIPRRALIAAGLAAVAGVAFYFAPPGRQLRARVKWFTDDPWGGARLNLWRDSALMAAGRLPAGYGPEVFTAEFPPFESLPLAQSYPNFAHESPHNIFLDALVAQGVPGLFLLAALCAVVLLTAYRKKQAAFAAALAAGIVSQQFTAFTLPTALVFWVTLGLVVALDTPSTEPRRRNAAVAGAVLAALALLYLAGRYTAADHELALAKRYLDQGDVAHAAAAYQSFEKGRLPGMSSALWYSRALLALASQSPKRETRVAAVQEARTAAIQATQTADDTFNAWYNLAVFCGSLNDAACVEHSLRQAIAANPMWFKPHWALAQVLRLTGRLDEAGREAARAAELDGGKDPETGRLLLDIRAQIAQELPSKK